MQRGLTAVRSTLVTRSARAQAKQFKRIGWPIAVAADNPTSAMIDRFGQEGVAPGTLLSLGQAVIGFGPNPAEKPILQPILWDEVIKLRTAKPVGLAAPHALRLRADEGIL
jgi:hypothetical protein